MSCIEPAKAIISATSANINKLLVGSIKEINISVKSRDFYLRIKDINIYNVLASLAIINELQLNFEKTNEIFKNLEPSFGRGREHSIKRYKKNFKLIDESYNASPMSVKNALNKFAKLKKKT